MQAFDTPIAQIPLAGHLSLGVDTGGTYTDAVLFDEDRGVVAKAKALTTRHDLTIGIAGAVDAVIARAGTCAADIALVSLSTTLATNALVEGRGGRVALVFIGFGERDADRSGLAAAMGGDPIIHIDGGHNPQGDPLDDLDVVALEREAAAVAQTVSGFAVTAQFATRNAEHELAARDLLVRLTGLPVTCGHELSARLDGPRRALTSVLNARLIGLITGLITAAEAIMRGHGMQAPLMVVRGDGSLMSAAMAKARPIETILSGPAASLVGAAYLTGAVNAIVADIGGTTTDVAVIEAGVPHIDDGGATVGGHRTMVEAVAMTTVGLGGDSEVGVESDSPRPVLRIGPKRVVPVSMLAVDHPEVVHRALDQQLLHDIPDDHHTRFVVPTSDAGASEIGLDDAELQLLERARRGVASVAGIVRGNADRRRLTRLVSRGLLMESGFTPTDASHVLGDYIAFDPVAAAKAATLMARKRTLLGKPVAADANAFSAWVVSTLQRRSAEVVLEVGLGIDGFEAANLSSHPLVAASLDSRAGIVDVGVRLTVPLVGLGASAGLYYPNVARMLRTDGIVPTDADVANAIGAVVGRVRVHADVYISAPERGRFRIHHAGVGHAGVGHAGVGHAGDGHAGVGHAGVGHAGVGDDVLDLDQALGAADALARTAAVAAALQAGTDAPEVVLTRVVNIATVDGEDLFIDATVTAVASGRPRRIAG